MELLQRQGHQENSGQQGLRKGVMAAKVAQRLSAGTICCRGLDCDPPKHIQALTLGTGACAEGVSEEKVGVPWWPCG